MSNVVIVKKGSKELNGTEIIDIPVRYIDNGDGTYSEAGSGSGGSGGDASAAKQDAQTALLQALVALGNTGYSKETTLQLVKDLLTSIDGLASYDNALLQSINLALQNTVATSSNQDIQKAVLDAIKVAQTLHKTYGQAIALALTSVQSSSVGSTTKRVVLTPTMDCWVELGTNPVAVVAGSTSIFLPAGIPSYPIDVTPSSTKIAVIATAASGYLSIFESL